MEYIYLSLRSVDEEKSLHRLAPLTSLDLLGLESVTDPKQGRGSFKHLHFKLPLKRAVPTKSIINLQRTSTILRATYKNIPTYRLLLRLKLLKK